MTTLVRSTDEKRVVLPVFSHTPSDSDFPWPPEDGQQAIRSTDDSAWVRVGGVWVAQSPDLSSIHPSDIGEYWDVRRPAECIALPRATAVTNNTLVAGTMYGMYARARSAFTATQMRMVIGATPFANTTDFYMCVWNSSTRALVARTASEHTALNAASGNTNFTKSLTGSLAVAQGDTFIIGCAILGNTAGTLKGVAITGIMTNSSFAVGTGIQMAYAPTGYTGGTPGTIGTTQAGLQNYCDLLP